MSGRTMDGKEGRATQVDARDYSDDEEQVPKKSSDRTLQQLLDKDLLYFIAIALAAFAIGIPVGYAVRGECGQVRFDNMDAILQKFLKETLKPNMEKTLKDVSTDFESLLNEQKTNLANLHTSLDDSDKKVKASTSQISESMSKLNTASENIDVKMKSLETNVNDMKSKLTTIKTDIEKSQQQLKQSATDFTTQSQAAVAEIKTSGGDASEAMSKIATKTIEEIKSKSSKYNSDFQTSADKVKSIIDTFDEKTEVLRTAVGEVSRQQVEFSRVVKETTHTGTALETAKTELEGQVGNLKKWESKVCADGKTEAKQDYVGWGLDIFQLIMIAIVYMAVTESRRDNAGRSTAPQGAMAARQVPVQRAPPGVGAGLGAGRRPPAGPARHEVTVVTFTQETYDQARRVFPEMLGQAWPAAGQVEYKMLTGELDLSQIPSSRGYIVVIGYDARNSILEDMDGSMGSRKRQTVVGLQSTKRDVLVIYIDSDHQIEEPPENALYNTHLDRPTSHPILRPLVDAQRFLSLRHWRGSRLQAAHMEKWLRALR